MKQILAVIGLGVSLLAGSVKAQTPTFVTLSTNTTGAAVETFFPAQPLYQARVVGVIASSDKATGKISITSGVGAYSISLSNAAGTTVTVSSTNGLAANDAVVIQQSGTNASGTISSFTGTTNIVLAAGIGATLPGAELFKMGTAATLKVGAVTNVNFQGEAIFVGNKGRPVRIVVDGTSFSSVDTASARYE